MKPHLAKPARAILILLLLGAAVSFGIGWAASWFEPMSERSSAMILQGGPGWSDGTVAIGACRSQFRTDLYIDPGPYSPAQRTSFLLPNGGTTGKELLVAAPWWIKRLALNHAGKDYNNWQARVAAFGWPLPVVYWRLVATEKEVTA